MAVGMGWYSNALFGSEWRELVGWNEALEKRTKLKMPLTFGASFIMFLLMAYVLAHVVEFVGATEIFEGVQTGFWMWLGFVATTMLINILYQGKQLKLFFIDSFYLLIVLLITGGILVAF